MALEILQPIKPVGNFPSVYAKDVDVEGEALTNFLPIILTYLQYEELVANGQITVDGQPLYFEEDRIYMIKRFVGEKQGE